MTPGQWIQRYRRAWETADADEVVDLFTPDASYRSSVFREPFTLPGCLLLRFAADGRCRDLWEYWQVQPGRQDPPDGWGA